MTGKIILICFTILILTSMYSQSNSPPTKDQQFRLIHSDKLFLSKLNEENVLELLGNVHFFYGTTEFTSLKAIIYDTQKIARLIGNVTVKNDTIKATADSVAYYRKADKLNLGGNVVITEQKKEGVFNQLTGNIGTYDKANNIITATGKVNAISLKDNARAKCNYAYWDKKNGYGYLIDKPELWSDGKDTLYVNSEKMEFFDEDRKVIATFNVTAQSKDYTATSDFLMYFLKEDKAIFIGEPKFTSNYADADAEEFYLYFKDRKLFKAELKDSCTVYFAEEESKPKTNWVKAKFITMNLDKDNLKDFTAEEEVTYYYIQEKQDKKDYFSNSASGSFLTADFNPDGKLNRMKMKGSVKGIYKFDNNAK